MICDRACPLLKLAVQRVQNKAQNSSPPYFEGNGLKKTCFATFWSKLCSVLEPPSPKNRIFFPKWPKHSVLSPKTVFLGTEWSVVGPPTLF